MKRIACLFLILCCSAFSQNILPKKVSSKTAAFDEYIETDDFGYEYFLKNNVLIKQKNKEIFEYKNIALGKITRIDLHNPLKIILFYENFNTVVTLDNQLNESNILNFSTFETPILATATGMSSQSRLWIFNSLSQKIGLFDWLNNSYLEITPPLQMTKKFSASDFNTFYWIDQDNILNSCDIFGKIKTNGKIIDFDKIQIIENSKILILKNNHLLLNDLEKNDTQTIEISEKSIENFSYKNQILTIFTNQTLHTYNIKLP